MSFTHGVVLVNTTVGDVGADALTGRRVIGVVVVTLLAVGDTGKTPGRARLGNVAGGGTSAVLLDVFDLEQC